MEVHQLPVFDDNYIYVLREPSGKVAVVDPALSEPVLAFLVEKNWKLDYIFNTHHHFDHVGGNLEIKEATGCQIVAAECDKTRIPGHDILLSDGDKFSFGSLKALVKEVPGHTLGHILYYFSDVSKLFCGDTVFAMGCGRLFEGSPEQMFQSLNWIKSLPSETEIYCAHEYTLTNAEFSLTIEPNNEALIARHKEVIEMRKADTPTIPTVLDRELKTNPFLRCDSVDDFARIRKLKDHY